MQVYLIRHGETIWNRERRYQGSQDIPLSESGIRKLKKADFSPATVYITSLMRTLQTARILFPDSEPEVVPGLEEMNFGVFEGRSYLEMEHDAQYRAWVDSGCLSKCPNGEDRGSFTDRICESFDRLLRRSSAAGEKQLVIVAHGGTQMALLGRSAVPKKEYYEWLTGNGCGYLLDADDWESRKELRIIREVSFCKET